ncbi:MAG: hypothetical protein JXA10_17585 [Anaerolineae bacterium]|nr:hypothetical protein [Anaerolineae bacterium]
MAKYELFHPDTEILGQVILDFESAIGYEKFGPILEKHQLTDLEPTRWYSGQRWVDVLNEIEDLQGISMLDFVSLGIQQMALVDWPPEFQEMSITDILLTLDEAYHQNYRGTDVGGIAAQVVADQHVALTIRSFEPDDLWYGNIYGLMRQFAPGREFTVYYDKDKSRRDMGGEHTVIHATWK